MKAQTPFASTSVVLLLRRVCTFFFKAVKCARDTVGLAQRYSSTSIFQKVDFGAGREREREESTKINTMADIQHTHTPTVHT